MKKLLNEWRQYINEREKDVQLNEDIQQIANDVISCFSGNDVEGMQRNLDVNLDSINAEIIAMKDYFDKFDALKSFPPRRKSFYYFKISFVKDGIGYDRDGGVRGGYYDSSNIVIYANVEPLANSIEDHVQNKIKSGELEVASFEEAEMNDFAFTEFDLEDFYDDIYAYADMYEDGVDEWSRNNVQKFAPHFKDFVFKYTVEVLQNDKYNLLIHELQHLFDHYYISSTPETEMGSEEYYNAGEELEARMREVQVDFLRHLQQSRNEGGELVQKFEEGDKGWLVRHIFNVHMPDYLKKELNSDNIKRYQKRFYTFIDNLLDRKNKDVE